MDATIGFLKYFRKKPDLPTCLYPLKFVTLIKLKGSKSDHF